MCKHTLWLTVALVVMLIAPLAQPVALAAPAAGGPDVSDVRAGTPAIFETFRQKTGNWPLGATESGERSIADGMLVINVADEDMINWSIYDGRPKTFGDFYLEVDATHLSGSVDNSSGVVFRMEDSDNGYLFEVDATGQYMLSKLVDNEWETIVGWTISGALNKGRDSENSLGVLAVGDWIVLLANDKELKRVRDATFSSGWVGLAGASYDTTGIEVGFDNFRLWQAATSGGSSQSGNASVTSDTLNVRSGPSTAYSVVATLRRGDGVQMVGRTADSQWVKISLTGKPQAWVATQYLSPNTRIQSLAVAATPSQPPVAAGSSCGNKAWLAIENHIGRYITLDVSDHNFRVEGKVGDVPGRLRVTLNGTGHYTAAAQLPNGGSTNFDIYVEATPDRCVNRTGCLALCQTMTIPFSLD